MGLRCGLQSTIVLEICFKNTGSCMIQDESYQSICSLEAKASGGRASMMMSLIAKKMRLNNGGSSNNKSELDKFLAEETEDGLQFDILAWWKVEGELLLVLCIRLLGS